MTCRWIKGLASKKEVNATVRGAFVFSGFSIEGNRGESHVGGGGGGQDFQFRFDHLRSHRPPIYPNRSSVFDASLKIHWADNEQYFVQSMDGSWKPHLESLADFQLDHVYRVKFAPKAGSTEVAFEVIDGGTLERTWDNVGELFITIEK